MKNSTAISIRERYLTAACFFILCVCPASASAKTKSKKASSAAQTDLQAYIARARAQYTVPTTTTGSLWSPQARWTALASDDKAHNVGDIVTILLADQYSSTSDNSIKTARTFNAQSSLATYLGTLAPGNGLQSVLTPSSAVNLNGSGQSAISSSLNVTLAGEVMDVLPNGMLVIQAARDMTVGNERQTIVVRGIVRPEDISPTDVASSAAFGNLQVQIKGKGVVSEGVRQPNIVVRTLLRLLAF